MKVAGSKSWGGTPVSFKGTQCLKVLAQGMGSPVLYETGLKAARRFINRTVGRMDITAAGPMSGWFSCRDLPPVAGEELPTALAGKIARGKPPKWQTCQRPVQAAAAGDKEGCE
jgi:hypothetical protein